MRGEKIKVRSWCLSGNKQNQTQQKLPSLNVLISIVAIAFLQIYFSLVQVISSFLSLFNSGQVIT